MCPPPTGGVLIIAVYNILVIAADVVLVVIAFDRLDVLIG